MVFVNGKFLTQNITGVQRYAIEMLSRIDKLADENEIIILVPNSDIKECYHIENFKNIRIKHLSKFKGIFWEQVILPLYCILKKKILLNLTCSAPMIYPSVVVMHDINFVKNRKFFNWMLVTEYDFIMRVAKLFGKQIYTVSEFSKQDMIDYYKIPANKIDVTYNAWQHLLDVKKDYSVIERLGLENRKFYFMLGSMSMNKNIERILEIASMEKEFYFVVSGRAHKAFNNSEKLKVNLDNVLFAGYLADEEIAVLYEQCYAFVFPSIYEGFGIPPLEALAMGCNRIVLSNTSALPEIYGEGFEYIDPFNKESIINGLKNCEIISEVTREKVLAKYNWNDSALKLYNKSIRN